jgi:PAS domain S-box-containing protein
MYRALFNTMGDGVAIIDAGPRRFIDVNPGMLAMYGYTREEMFSLTYEDLAAEENDAEQSTRDVLGGRLKHIPRRLHRRKDGTTFPVAFSIGSFKLGRRNVMCGIVRDISERDQAEQSLRQSRRELRTLAGRLHALLEEERKRIAREVHDELGQSLTALKLDISLLPLPSDPDTGERLATILDTLDRAMACAQRITTELRPGLLDDLGLAAALAWQAKQFQRRTGIRCVLHDDPPEPPLQEEARVAMFRCFQEILTNIARHAGATRVEIWLETKERMVELRVADNGRGITLQQSQGHRSWGIIGMRERMNAVGGKLKLYGWRGKGTTVRVVTSSHREGVAS